MKPKRSPKRIERLKKENQTVREKDSQTRPSYFQIE